jgi:hypothetical protein
VDERRRCGDDDFPKHASVIRYRGRVPVDAVLRVLEDDPVRTDPEGRGMR